MDLLAKTEYNMFSLVCNYTITMVCCLFGMSPIYLQYIGYGSSSSDLLCCASTEEESVFNCTWKYAMSKPPM